MNIPDNVRRFALLPYEELSADRHRSLCCLENILIEHFLTSDDVRSGARRWDTQWRTFALFVAEELQGNERPQQMVIGLFSVDRMGRHCLHAGEATSAAAQRIRKLLNTSVTGGPYRMSIAIAAPIDGVATDGKDQP